MARWYIVQTTDYAWQPTQVHGILTVDDAVTSPQEAARLLFGTAERADVLVTQPSADEIVATIRYSPQVKAGFVRDREAPGDYTVTFRAMRVF